MIWIPWRRPVSHFRIAGPGERCHHCGTRVFARDGLDHYKVCGRSAW